MNDIPLILSNMMITATTTILLIVRRFDAYMTIIRKMNFVKKERSGGGGVNNLTNRSTKNSA